MTKIIVQTLAREKRAAILENNQIEQIMIEQPKHRSLVGNIYYGTVADVVPGMNAAFVHIGEERNGFLVRNKLPAYVQEVSKEPRNPKKQMITRYLHEGEKILVQVDKDGIGNKGARLTALVELESELFIYIRGGCHVAVSKKLPETMREKLREIGHKIKTDEEGLIMRTACGSATEADMQAQVDMLRKRYVALEKAAKQLDKPGLLYEKDMFAKKLLREIKHIDDVEIIVDELSVKRHLDELLKEDPSVTILLANDVDMVSLSQKIDAEITKSLKRIVWLENGAYVVFDDAEALTIIDVNTGKYVGKSSLRQTILQVNEWAMVEIARQIKLRDLGGMILIDFIDMQEEADRAFILNIAKRELEKDKKRTRIVGFTSLGILQMTRKKTNKSVAEALTVNCAVCKGTGKVRHAETKAFELERELWEYRYTDCDAVLVEATNDVISVFSGPDDIYLKQLENRFHLTIYFIKKADVKPSYIIRHYGSKEDVARLSKGNIK